MIIHPDGRLEGSPEELALYQKNMQDIQVKIEYVPIAKEVPYWKYKHWPPPYKTEITGDSTCDYDAEGVRT